MSRRLRLAAGPVLSALGLVVMTALPLAAQRPQGGRRAPSQDRQELEQRIRARMGEVMKRQLGLDDAQAERLSTVVQRFETQRREIAVREQAVRRRVQELLQDGGTDEAAAELLTRMAELRTREAELLVEEQSALREVLSPLQILKLQAMREQLGERIRALRGGGPGPSGARPPGPGAATPLPRGPGG